MRKQPSNQRSIFDADVRVESGESPDVLLDEIRKDAIACRACTCYKHRSRPDGVVMSDGLVTAKLMVISEAPGRTEDAKGIPFTGAAGMKLNEILEWTGLVRGRDVFLCNTLKCWVGPGNPTPSAREVKACFPLLERQIAVVRPKVICAAGNIAFKAITTEDLPMRDAHGKVFYYKKLNIPVIPTYHPSALLRTTDPAMRDIMRKHVASDWVRVRELLNELA